jgi:hypothetical protein
MTKEVSKIIGQKNNILLFIIVVLLILLVVYGYYIHSKINGYKIEGFIANSDNSCNYYPWGPTEESCVKNCVSDDRVGLWDTDGSKCTEGVCVNICAGCTDESRCQWINTWSDKEKERMLALNKSNTPISKLVPRKLNITGISYPDTEYTGRDLVNPMDEGDGGANREKYDGKVNIKIFWENYGDASAFMFHYYDMKSTNNMIKVEYIKDDDNIDGARIDIKTIKTYSINNLDSNTKYSIIVYGINEYGISGSSNIVLIET